jgi:hypothetical protein
LASDDLPPDTDALAACLTERDEAVETGHEPEQQRQVQRLQADRDRDRDPVFRVEGEHLLDRVPVAWRSGPDQPPP